jgi:hypothetical protein
VFIFKGTQPGFGGLLACFKDFFRDGGLLEQLHASGLSGQKTQQRPFVTWDPIVGTWGAWKTAELQSTVASRLFWIGGQSRAIPWDSGRELAAKLCVT